LLSVMILFYNSTNGLTLDAILKEKIWDLQVIGSYFLFIKTVSQNIRGITFLLL
jgi:hypothetical protein